MIQDVLLGSQVGLPWHKSSSPSATPGGQHRNFHTNLKIVSNFLVASPATRLPLNHALFLSEIMEIVMLIALSELSC